MTETPDERLDRLIRQPGFGRWAAFLLAREDHRERMLRDLRIMTWQDKDCVRQGYRWARDYVEGRLGYKLAKRNRSPTFADWTDHFMELVVEFAREALTQQQEHEAKLKRNASKGA